MEVSPIIKSIKKLSLAAALALASASFADNPIINYHYLADPSAVVVGDRLFIIADTDDESGSDGYTIKAYYALSTKDMVNWTNHGEVFRVPRDVSWASGAWAPAVAYRNSKVYVYFPNGASGVGVVVASTPEGPYKDVLGKQLVGGYGSSAGAVGCDNIAWCFDPGVFVDDDGKAFLTFGGGNNDTRPYGSNFDIIELNEDMISFKTNTPTRITGTTSSFEASYITKYNGKYYFSYSSQNQTIKYAMSDSPTSGYVYKGEFIANPNINGTNINANNNNHQAIVEFKDKWYAVYHDRRMAIALNNSAPAYHRSVSIDLLTYKTNGEFNSLTFTNEGPASIGNFDPYDSIPATTGSLMQNVASRTDLVTNAPPRSLLIPKPKTGTSWYRISNVDFGSGGATKFTVNAASLNDNNAVEIRTGSATGTLATTCKLTNTGSWTSYATTECAVSGLTGVVSQMYLVFTGTADSTAALLWWKMVSAPTVPQGPYADTLAIPGTIEAENYDVGGAGYAYYDETSANEGDADFRTTESVDIVTGNSGKAVGYTVAGEWMEYTVNVAKAGTYTFDAMVASGSKSSSFQMFLDDVAITDTVKVDSSSWTDYSTASGTTKALATGAHVLKIAITGSYVNIDKIVFSDGITKLMTSPKKSKAGESKKAKHFDLLGRKAE